MYYYKLFLVALAAILIFKPSLAQDKNFNDELSVEQVKRNSLSAVTYQKVLRKTFKKVNHSTAFFIGSKNFLLTAAHNVTKIKLHNAYYVSLFPARAGSKCPYDSLEFDLNYDDQVRIPEKYIRIIKNRRIKYDLALLYIPDSILNKASVFNKIEPLQFLPSDEKLKKCEVVYCPGYPAAGKYEGEYVMTMDTSRVMGIHPKYFDHKLETESGNSGSPILVKRKDRFYVVGVHSNLYAGTYLNPDRIKKIQSWMKELKNK